MTTEYTPTDLSSIKKAKGIKSPADLEQEISRISEVLKDLSRFMMLV
jgi:hypothetical protein